MKKFSVMALAVASATTSAVNAGEMEHALVSMPVHKKAAETALPAVSVEPVLADRVEVLRGPSTLLYGGVELRHATSSSGDTFIGRVDGGDGNFAWHLDGLLRDWNVVLAVFR